MATKKKKHKVLERGSEHYKGGGIEPAEYIFANRLDFFEGNVVKYVTRWRRSGKGKEDLVKAKHYVDMLLAFEADHE